MTNLPTDNVRPLRGPGSKRSHPSTDPNLEAWATEKPYNISEHYGKSIDGQHESTQVRLKVPTALVVQVTQMITTRELSRYKEFNEFARDAMVHRLRYLNLEVQSGVLASVIDNEIADATAAAIRSQHDQAQARVEHMAADLAEAQKSNDRAMARRLFEQEDVPGLDEPWLTRYRDLFDQYRHMVSDTSDDE